MAAGIICTGQGEIGKAMPGEAGGVACQAIDRKAVKIP